MNTKIILLLVAAITVCSCGPGFDEEGSTHSLYIKNATDTDIKVVYIKIQDGIRISHEIESGEEIRFFTVLSGMKYRPYSNPSTYDTAYVYYKNKILVDSIQGKGLLMHDNFIEDKKETYTKKYETYYKKVFTIDSAYINSHLK